VICRLIFVIIVCCSTNVLFAQHAFENKVSSRLLKQLASGNDKDSLEISVQVLDTAILKTVHAAITDAYFPANIYFIHISRSDAEKLLQNDAISFADVKQKPKEELTTGSLDLSLNRINYAHHVFPAINGDSILASIKEQQFDTADIDYKNRIVNTGQAAPGVTTHASIMATILAGGANTSPFSLGAAPAAYLTSATFNSLIPQPDSIYRRYNISIQNHSYGTAIENFYGNEAAAYDASVVNNRTLLHVFSAGNSGSSNATSGIYTASPGFANLTGNFKSAKNILVVGALDSFANVAALSSRGPANDGRIKPELVAFGEDGSSGAAAMTSGTAALLQQYYKRRSGKIPSSALMRSIIVNSADDIGNPHVDFISGFGSLNAFQAIKTMEENRFIEDSAGNGQTKTFSLTVPAGIKQVKLTLAWTDPAAAANSSKALINDLDLQVKEVSSGIVYLPWTLDPRPAYLSQFALRKQDTLNNIEQVTIDDPVQGIYSIEVKGARITTSAQNFALSWQTDAVNNFRWTFPTSTDQVIAATTNVIRWDTNIPGTGTIEYSTDGNVWRLISNTVDLSKKYLKWNAPDSFVIGLLRMRILTAGDIVSDSFVISRPTSVFTGFNCKDSFMLHWHQLPANQYEVYELGFKYLQPFTSISDTFLVLNKNQHPSLFYAVAPLIHSKPGLRSFTIKYDAQGVECYFRNFYIQLQTDDRVSFSAALGSLFNVSRLTFQKLTANGYVDLAVINNPSSLNFSFSDSGLHRGVNFYRLQLMLSDGRIIYSESVPVYFFPDLPVIIYPNPLSRNSSLHIISQQAVRYSIAVYDINGRQIMKTNLKEVVNSIPGYRFSTGVFFIVISNEKGRISTQKLIVY
jgi:hypothetical protein